MGKILITGANGQIGTELKTALNNKYGSDNVIISDLNELTNQNSNLFYKLDVRDKDTLKNIIEKNNIKIIYHLAALLSATGENNPSLCWDVNINGTLNILNLGVELKVERIFVPSSIAVWGENIETNNTPQNSVLQPTTMYGVTKSACESMCNYYFRKYALDVRGLRYPGIISSETLPGGGTTDYAVEIFYKAITENHYNCFLKEDAALPMMFMEDCINATLNLMDAELSNLRKHSDYNIAAVSFTPKELFEEIKKHLPNFTIEYNPDFRQKIAESWPRSIDDSFAREDWNWKHKFGLKEIVEVMLENLIPRLKK